MASVQELLRRGDTLSSDSPRRDVEILLGYCLGKSRSWLYTWPDNEVDPAAAAHFEALVQRRAGGEPVAHLTGQRDFWSLSLAVDGSTLIPRPETETLVAWALELALPADAEVLDLGTGTGAIALALASERADWRITGVDISEGAVELARRNAAAAGLEATCFRVSDWFAGLDLHKYHLVVSNPPYIDAVDPHLEQGDLRFEPRSALVAGDKGLADLALIVRASPSHLLPGGWLLLEHGFEQGAAVRNLLHEHGFTCVET
ncbi:MAG: peptide chain release factor N(5)-glutamine methyltransferase, partial [Halioglobus sp.]